jgi:TRAP-type C4-dicarboxylate transport system substrate-binding protein
MAPGSHIFKEVNFVKRLFLVLLAIALLVPFIFAGCTQTPSEVTTLKYSDQNSETGWEGSHAAVPWLNQIETATNGAIKFETFFDQSLFKGVDAWESLQTGQADVAWCFHGYWPGMTPLADVIALPFLPVPSAEKGSEVLWKLYEQYPSISKEFEANHVVLTWTSNSYFLATANKQVKTMDDIKGLRIRTTGGPPTDMIKALGAVPVSMGMPDVYLNLEKGVIDGALLPWEALYSFKLYEVVKYITVAPFHCVYFTQSFNTNSWNNLPSAIQEQIMSVSGLAGSKFWGKNMFDTAAVEVRSIVQEQNYDLVEYTLPADEVAKWRAIAGEPLWETWVAAQEAAGNTDARDILNTTLNLLGQS